MIQIGDRVRVGGFQPMITMEYYEGATGIITGIEKNDGLGDVVSVQLDRNDKIIQTRRQFCQKE